MFNKDMDTIAMLMLWSARHMTNTEELKEWVNGKKREQRVEKGMLDGL
jgi:hypothetical protein